MPMMSLTTLRQIARASTHAAHLAPVLDLRDAENLTQYQAGQAEGAVLAQLYQAHHKTASAYRLTAAQIALDAEPRSLGAAHVLLDAARRIEHAEYGPRA